MNIHRTFTNYLSFAFYAVTHKLYFWGCQGTEEVEGISLKLDLKDVHLNLSCQVFDKMPNLRLLTFTYNYYVSNRVHLPDGLNSLPDDLIILKWYGYPLRALPSNFILEKLVELDLSFSNIEQLWEETKV